MSGTFIFIAVMAITVILAKHAIAEGQRAERHKRFMRDMDNFDKKKK